MEFYNAFKVIHLLGVVLFLGNIIVTALWKTLADRTREPRVIAYSQHLVTVTDWIFTAGGVLLVVIGAYGMIKTGGLDPFGTPWLIWGQGLLLASGVIWVVVLIPTQIAQARLARGFAAGGLIPERYWLLNRRWLVCWRSLCTFIIVRIHRRRNRTVRRTTIFPNCAGVWFTGKHHASRLGRLVLADS